MGAPWTDLQWLCWYGLTQGQANSSNDLVQVGHLALLVLHASQQQPFSFASLELLFMASNAASAGETRLRIYAAQV